MATSKVTNDLTTIRDYLRWAVSQFNAVGLHYGHGNESAWDEAVQLVLSPLHLQLDVDPQVIDAKLTMAERQEIVKIILRRVNDRVPAAYLTHEAWFAGMPFYVDERVLIPRSPFGELIEREFSPWVVPQNVHRILDLCTGSGCIAVASALVFAESEVDAVDISKDALVVAKKNVERYHLDNRVQLFQSDLFAELADVRYDLIICNPPYVGAEEMATLPAEYYHEPRIGLETADEGLAIVNRLLNQARDYLTEEGMLFVEVGNSEHLLMERYPNVPFTWLDLERGGHGVFMLTAKQLDALQSQLKEVR